MKISVEGAEPALASLVVVLLHGAGARALDFLALSQDFPTDEELCWLAPQALNERWFPGHGTAESRSMREPHYTISVESVLGLLQEHASSKLALIGFSEGAGVVAELLAHPDLPSSVRAAWMASGGLVGPTDEWPTPSKLGLSVLVSGSREDARAGEATLTGTARVLERAGACVSIWLYDGATHHIADEELSRARALLREARG